MKISSPDPHLYTDLFDVPGDLSDALVRSTRFRVCHLLLVLSLSLSNSMSLSLSLSFSLVLFFLLDFLPAKGIAVVVVFVVVFRFRPTLTATAFRDISTVATAFLGNQTKGHRIKGGQVT